MSQNQNIHNVDPGTVLEEALLYRTLEQQGGEVNDDLGLPDPTPREEWLLKEASGDKIFHGLMLSKDDNENRWAKAQRSGLSQEEHFHEMDQYDLARWGLGEAMKKRRRELDEKRRKP